jgi:hypothetical protein
VQIIPPTSNGTWRRFHDNSLIDELELMKIKLRMLQQTGEDAAAIGQRNRPLRG